VAVGARLGLKVVAVLRGEPEQVPDGNFLICSLLGADFRFITSADYRNVDAIMEDMAQEYRQKGFRLYVIPGGGSNGIGVLGYAKAAEEMAGYIRSVSLPR